ncbi:very-long-chain 3-oxoacyl-CoA reductase 1-like [Amaranthus tricolor]|uniref:very-long-chain 3-oxoacyl-CoA reductase 1-like n=1 Tax=Amaranthus tricolor TaxID=29722 RepID=UPI0025843740|nr:very-long-chain 3-oxoacyl-CoA reductase 1-like [Amaranthus tricolor]
MASLTMDWNETLILSISMIGLFLLFIQILKFIKWVYFMFIRSPKKLTNYGSWALVTGSTDGIGKSLCFELASKGLSLILVGRNPQKLQITSNEIRAKYEKIKIKSIIIDFEKISGEEIEAKINREIEDMDVGILINNVGLEIEGTRYFHEMKLEGLCSVLNVNIGNVNWVTRGVLPGMLKRKKGAIVNVGSGSSGAIPTYPLFSVYCSTKAYIAMFSKSLTLEYKKFGIDIQCQIPLLVATKMASIKKSSFFVPSPEQYSKASVKWMGHNSSYCVPYWTHALQWRLMSLVPDSLLNWILLQYFITIRTKRLHKETKFA